MDEYQRKRAIIDEFVTKLEKLSNEQIILLTLSEIVSYHEAKSLPMFKALSEVLASRSSFDN